MKHFDFLLSLSKSTPDEAQKLLIGATNDQLKALVICLSLRTQVLEPPVSLTEKRIIAILERSKRKKFSKKILKVLISILTVVLAKFAKESVDSICDLS